MNKILLFLISFYLTLISTLANATTFGGWSIQNVSPQGASAHLEALKNNAKSHALIRPNAAQVAKVLRGGAAGVALGLAVDQLLGAVDWVLDPANNQIKYKEPLPDNSTVPWIWATGAGQQSDFIYPTAEAAGQAICAYYNQNYNKIYWYSHPVNASVAYVWCVRADGSRDNWDVRGKSNPAYDPDLKPVEKTLSLENVAEKVISNADSGSPEAQEATIAAAQDILSEAESNSDVARPIQNQLEANSTGGDPNQPEDPDENSGKQAKKLNDKQISDITKNPNWHKTNLKKKIVNAYSRELKGSKNFDFYKDPKTGDVFIKGNKSKDMIRINMEQFL